MIKMVTTDKGLRPDIVFTHLVRHEIVSAFARMMSTVGPSSNLQLILHWRTDAAEY